MPKERATTRKTAKKDGGKKKKGMSSIAITSLKQLRIVTNSIARPQRPQAWSFRLHVLRQRDT